MASIYTRTGFVQRSAFVVCFALLFSYSNAQVISNNGAAISLTNGVVVHTDTVANGAGLITNNGTFTVLGDYRNAATTEGNGTINLGGDWLNTGVFNHGTGTVQFNGNNLQTITKAGGEAFYNVIINNAGAGISNRIILPQQVNVNGTLNMVLGNIDPGANKLYLTNAAPDALIYTSTTGSRILGKFERGVNAMGNYLFPLGTLGNYNPIHLNTNLVPTSGTVLSEFIAADPGSNGLPLTDTTYSDSVEVYQAYDDGYWNLVSNTFSISDFNVRMDGSGFTPAIQDITRVLKRTNGSNWILDGTHQDAAGTLGIRNNLKTNISSSSTQFALALGRPRIWVHPEDTAVCNGESASFSVYATGRSTLTYQWEISINNGVSWSNVTNGGIYSGATSKTLQLSSTNLAMNGYQYRVRVTDARGNSNTSNAALLTVNPIPIAYGTPQIDTICDFGTTNIMLTSDVPGTTFHIEVLRSGNVLGTDNTLTGGNSIQQILNNPTDIYDYVEYRIIPTGPFSTYCVGKADTVRIYVNPTPRAIATVFRDTICNDSQDRIRFTSPSIFTTGVVTFNYTSVTTGGLSGNSSGTNLPIGHEFQDLLHNPTAWPASPERVTYSVTPLAPLGCASGPITTANVTVHPTADTYFDFSNYNTEDSVTCYLDSDAFATVVAQNGVNQFTYLWDDPSNQTTRRASGLAMGEYIVTITDNQGCVTWDTIQIKQPDRLTPILDSLKSVTCFGYADGYVAVSQTGGNGGFIYEWSERIETTSYLKDLSGDIYTVTITDYRGCHVDTSFYLFEPNELSASVYGYPETCYDYDDGRATAYAPGAQEFLWSNGETTSNIYNLKPGTYSVIITDNEACKIEKTVIVDSVDVLDVWLIPSVIDCPGEGDGTIDLGVSGGNGGYSYSWSNGSTDQDLLGLSGGEYSVTVTDWKGCTIKDTAFVFEPPVFVSDIVSEDITCFGNNDGTATLTTVGGTGNHTYLWSTGATDTSLTDLLPGTYYVTITDGNSCIYNDSVTITEPAELKAHIEKTDVQCYNSANGTAIVSIIGGNQISAVTWSNGMSNDTVSGLTPGKYYVSVIDIKGCAASDSVEIGQPEAIENNLQKANITCFGFNNGQISVSPTGGITPYVYSWSHDTTITVNSLNNLVPGPYTVYVTDSNGCVSASDVEITQPDPLIATIEKEDITCYGFGNGSIRISMYGGTPAYNYDWSNGNTSTFQSLLNKGNYTISVTDAQNCQLDTIIEIIEPSILAVDPTLGRSSCPDIQDGFIELNLTGGVGMYSIFWSNGSSDENLYNIRSGKYTVNIYDANNCGLERDIVLPSGKDYCVTIPSAFTPNNDGTNDVWTIENMDELYPNSDIEVFDRRGVRVFYSRGYSPSEYWDGTFNGKELPMDSYYYVIYLKNGLGRISGVVTIIR